MSITLHPEELISISEFRKNIGPIKRAFKSGTRNRVVLTDNGHVFAVVVKMEDYVNTFPFQEVPSFLPKKVHTKEDLKKVTFKGQKNLSKTIDDIYRFV